MVLTFSTKDDAIAFAEKNGNPFKHQSKIISLFEEFAKTDNRFKKNHVFLCIELKCGTTIQLEQAVCHILPRPV